MNLHSLYPGNASVTGALTFAFWVVLVSFSDGSADFSDIMSALVLKL